MNNEYCVMFKRGAFDLGVTVCPIAIKYNKIFVDAFWNRRALAPRRVPRVCRPARPQPPRCGVHSKQLSVTCLLVLRPP